MRAVIVGTPNAGKSSLFNVLSISKAVTGKEAGVTRDWCVGRSKEGWDVVDTPGIELFEKPWWWDDLRPDVYLWVVDGCLGLREIDTQIGKWLRGDVPVVLCVNKCDLATQWNGGFEFERYDVSAKRRIGCRKLIDRIGDFCTEVESSPKVEGMKLMIVGGPNAGKSSLVNRFAGHKRVTISEKEGTTVDVVKVDCDVGEVSDTPGIKRRKYCGYMGRAVLSMKGRIQRFKGVVLFVVDVTRECTSRDLRIARMAWDTGNPVILVVNKMDMVKGDAVSGEWLQRMKIVVSEAKVALVSAIDGRGIDELVSMCKGVYKAWVKRISTKRINDWAKESGVGVSYLCQVGTSPPELFIAEKGLRESFVKNVCQKFRKKYGMQSVPICVKKKFY